jgi:hypothetical protein
MTAEYVRPNLPPKRRKSTAKPVTPEQLAKSGTEDGEQTALFCHAAEAAKTDYRWGLLYAIPNGGKRGVATAARMVATGTRTGFPDVGLAVAQPFVASLATRYHGLFIELKRLAHLGKPAGRVDDAQKYWHEALRGQGYRVEVCYGWEHARDTIQAYLDGCNS